MKVPNSEFGFFSATALDAVAVIFPGSRPFCRPSVCMYVCVCMCVCPNFVKLELLLQFLSATKRRYTITRVRHRVRPSVRPSGLVGGYLSRSLSVHRSLVANVVTCRTGATSDSVKMRRFNLKHQEKQEKYFVRQLFSDSKFGSSVHFK